MTLTAATTSLHEIIRSRRSVRRFTDEPVPQALVERILETAMYAPNAHNRQPWRFVVLSNPKHRTRLADAMGREFRKTLLGEGVPVEEAEAQVARSKARIVEAPAAVLLCMDAAVIDSYTDPKRQEGEKLMAMQSVAIAGGYLLLAAHAEELGGVWMCAPLFVPETVQEALDLPESWEAQGLLLLGYSAVEGKARERKPIEDMMVYL
jgi:F420 biosynthesis protein FbiB-like protein